MNHPQARLRNLQRRLTPWLDPIRRATGADALHFVHHPDGSFDLVAEWTRGAAAGARLSRSFADSSLDRRVCDHARDFMRAVLVERGVVSP
jgi:hypothetical protein